MKKYILIVAVVAIVLNWTAIANFISSSTDYAVTHDGKVILYATSWCGYCEKTRELLKENDIKYHEYDIENSQEGRKQYNQLGVEGVPVLLINGEVVDGYDPSKIMKLTSKL